MDEPCSALDPRSTAVIEELILPAARGARDRDRHAQPPAGAPRRRPRRVHVPRRPRRAGRDRADLRRRRARARRASTSPAPSDERAPPRRSRRGARRRWRERLRDDAGAERQDRAARSATRARSPARPRIGARQPRRARRRARRWSAGGPAAVALELTNTSARAAGRRPGADRRARREGRVGLPQRHEGDRALAPAARAAAGPRDGVVGRQRGARERRRAQRRRRCASAPRRRRRRHAARDHGRRRQRERQLPRAARQRRRVRNGSSDRAARSCRCTRSRCAAGASSAPDARSSPRWLPAQARRSRSRWSAR